MANRLNKRRKRYGLPTVPRWYRKHGKTVPEILAKAILEPHPLLDAAPASGALVTARETGS